MRCAVALVVCSSSYLTALAGTSHLLARTLHALSVGVTPSSSVAAIMALSPRLTSRRRYVEPHTTVWAPAGCLRAVLGTERCRARMCWCWSAVMWLVVPPSPKSLSLASSFLALLTSPGCCDPRCVTISLYTTSTANLSVFCVWLVQVIEELELEQHGFEYLPRDPSSFTPSKVDGPNGGKSLMFWDSMAKVCVLAFWRCNRGPRSSRRVCWRRLRRRSLSPSSPPRTPRPSSTTSAFSCRSASS